MEFPHLVALMLPWDRSACGRTGPQSLCRTGWSGCWSCPGYVLSCVVQSWRAGARWSPAELCSKQWPGRPLWPPPQLQPGSNASKPIKSIKQTPVTRGHMHHRGQSAERHRPAVTHTCLLIYVALSSQKKSFQRPGRTSESFVLVLKLNFTVTLSCCYRTSWKPHFLHHGTHKSQVLH